MNHKVKAYMESQTCYWGICSLSVYARGECYEHFMVIESICFKD